MIISMLLGWALMAMSAVSFLLGAALAGIGIWVLYSKDQLRSILNLVDTSSLPSQASEAKGKVDALMDQYDTISTIGLIILIIGAFIAAVAFLGFFGTFCNMKIVLLVYVIITGVLFTCLLIGVLYFGTFKARLDDEIKKGMRRLQTEYLVSVVSLANDRGSAKAAATLTINFMQLKLKCCGVDSVGDARNSSSWLQSERSLMALQNSGVSFDKASRRRREAEPAVPDWLKSQLPKNVTKLPKGTPDLPKSLPKGFELPKDFKTQLTQLHDNSNFTAETLSALFNNTMTIRTPITCCKISDPEKLLSGKYDPKKAYKSLSDPTCAFSATNKGINDKTCFDALLDYISSYQHLVVTVGTILAIIIGAGAGCALWIYCFN